MTTFRHFSEGVHQPPEIAGQDGRRVWICLAGGEVVREGLAYYPGLRDATRLYQSCERPGKIIRDAKWAGGVHLNQ